MGPGLPTTETNEGQLETTGRKALKMLWENAGCNYRAATEIFLAPQMTPTFAKMCPMSPEARSTLQTSRCYTRITQEKGDFTVAGST